MTIATFSALLLSMACLSLPLQATADTAQSSCEVWHSSELEQGSSGDCMWSQRQGYIGITLKNGVRIDLSPKGTLEYTDANDQKVTRSIDQNGQNTFQWPDRTIIVRFGTGA